MMLTQMMKFHQRWVIDIGHLVVALVVSMRNPHTSIIIMYANMSAVGSGAQMEKKENGQN